MWCTSIHCILGIDFHREKMYRKELVHSDVMLYYLLSDSLLWFWHSILYCFYLAGCPDFDRFMRCPDGKKDDANGCPLSECGESDWNAEIKVVSSHDKVGVKSVENTIDSGPIQTFSIQRESLGKAFVGLPDPSYQIFDTLVLHLQGCFSFKGFEEDSAWLCLRIFLKVFRFWSSYPFLSCCHLSLTDTNPLTTEWPPVWLQNVFNSSWGSLFPTSTGPRIILWISCS